MEHTLTCIEKMDGLLKETDEYIKCSMHAEDSDIKSAYRDLAECHYNGYENLRRAADRMVDKKVHSHPDGSYLKKMADWHLEKYDDKAQHLKKKLDNLR